jgi:hypothetical protein
VCYARGCHAGRRSLWSPARAGARKIGARAPTTAGDLSPFQIYHLGFPTGVGPRVDDIMATAIPGFYLSPYEDLKLKRP